MIVHQNEAGGMAGQRVFHNAARVNRYLVHRAFVNDVMSQQFVLNVCVNNHEGFMRKPGQLHCGEIHHALRVR